MAPSGEERDPVNRPESGEQRHRLRGEPAEREQRQVDAGEGDTGPEGQALRDADDVGEGAGEFAEGRVGALIRTERSHPVPQKTANVQTRV
ncbi:hypothetical protein ACFQL4_19290 [Halosimplex aquaticum]